jgi:phosphatidylserine/phosphatidylglycerophosphate/cardiolipin synthase-like enzyme
MFLEGAKSGIGDNNRKTAKVLTRHQIPVFFSSANKTNHSKLFIFDNKRILAGTTNLSESSLSKNLETNYCFDSPQISKKLIEYKQKLILNPSEDVNIAFTDRNITLLTDREFLPNALDLLNSAQNSVKIATYLLNFDPRYPNGSLGLLVSMLNDLNSRNRQITVFCENSNMPFNLHIKNKNAVTMDYLSDKGIKDLYWDSLDNITHGKLIIVDSKNTLAGSTNWYHKGIDSHHQVNFIFRDHKFSRTMENYFDNLVKNGFLYSKNIQKEEK